MMCLFFFKCIKIGKSLCSVLLPGWPVFYELENRKSEREIIKDGLGMMEKICFVYSTRYVNLRINNLNINTCMQCRLHEQQQNPKKLWQWEPPDISGENGFCVLVMEIGGIGGFIVSLYDEGCTLRKKY